MNKENLNELALFAGAGGGILGGHLLGWRTVCAVEWEPYPASVLCARQNDGLLPPFPIWDDVCSFDGKPWRGIVDVISGGFPCQDISAAGKGAGIDGERSGMWREMARIIHEVRPRFVFVENSPMLTSRGLGAVLGDLATMGFDAKWGVLGANDIGANHQRDRIWIRAEQMGNTHNDGQTYTKICPSFTQRSDTSSTWQEQTRQFERSSEQYAELANTNCNRLHGSKTEWDRESEWSICKNQSDNRSEIWSEIDRCSKFGSKEKISNTQAIGLQGSGQHEQSFHSKTSRQRKADGLIYGRSPEFWAIEPNVGRVAHGVASRVDRIKAIGNGQVPLCAATAWRILE
jgi:DNA (cytosine-5)-methyltransferase 1